MASTTETTPEGTSTISNTSTSSSTNEGNVTLVPLALPQLTEEEKVAAILKQVEYYFSIQNLTRDNFLNGVILSNPEGWVPLSVLITFNRLKALSTDIPYLADVLRKSSVLQVSPDGQSVRVENPFRRVIGGKTFENRDEIRQYFHDILSRNEPEMKLNEEEARLVIALLQNHPRLQDKVGSDDTIEGVKIGNHPEHPESKCFIIMLSNGSQKDFSYLKCIAAVYPTGGENKDKQNKRKFEQKEKKKQKIKEDEDEDEKKPLFVPGCILLFKGTDEEQRQVDKFKDRFNKYGKVKFVDVSKDNDAVYVRFETPEAALESLKEADDHKKFAGPNSELTLLQGDEENQYYAKNVLRSGSNRGRRGGRGGRGFRGGQRQKTY